MVCAGKDLKIIQFQPGAVGRDTSTSPGCSEPHPGSSHGQSPAFAAVKVGWDSKMNIQLGMEEIFLLSSKSERIELMFILGAQEVMTPSLKRWNSATLSVSSGCLKIQTNMWPCYWTSVKNVPNIPSLQGYRSASRHWLTGHSLFSPSCSCCCPGCPHLSSLSTPRRKYCPGLNLPEALSMRNCSMLTPWIIVCSAF